MTDLAASAVVTPDGLVGPSVVVVEDGRVRAVEATSGPVPDRILVPGFVDMQVNGHDDIDVAGAQGPDWDRLDDIVASQGVTTWCPTLVTAPLDSYARPLGRIAEAAARGGLRPRIAGAHLEGPFLGGLPGAHDRSRIVPLDLSWLAALPDVVRLVTLGAELDHAVEAIRLLTGRGVLVSVGHSAATYDEAVEAAEAGARLATHLFNAMSPLHHREPGVTGAALTDARLTPSLIADLVHVHPAAIAVAFRTRGPAGIALVTDAVGWRSGRVGAAGVTRAPGDAPRRPDGTIAGSALRMDEAVANVVRHCGVGLAEAVGAASSTPARLLGLSDAGAIEAGRRADIVALDPAELRCRQTWIAGETVWAA
ncbi:MAG TPA: amidohydrolase family protein [Acidimicrobiales bacterium]|nr:amidohydrolase family protein [Acidimicrobiales bacterium]